LCALELRQLTTLVEKETQKTEDLIQKYKAVLEFLDNTKEKLLSAEDSERLRDALVFRRQLLIYLDAIQVFLK
jgi:hypothetical protein